MQDPCQSMPTTVEIHSCRSIYYQPFFLYFATKDWNEAMFQHTCNRYLAEPTTLHLQLSNTTECKGSCQFHALTAGTSH